MRACLTCGVSLEGRSIRARYCSAACRAKGNRGGLSDSPRLAALPVAVPVDGACGPLEAAVTAELERGGVRDTAAGQAALACARRVDAGTEQAAPLIRQMHESMDRVLTKASGKSRLEQLRERRGA